MHFSGIWAVLQFERKRTATRTRWMWWSILTFFPVVIVGINRLFGAEEIALSNFVTVVFYLIPVVMCLLGQLLWATPFLQSELEGKTWSYLALRPHGKIHVLLGKYLTSVIWSFSAAAISMTLVIFVSTPKITTSHLVPNDRAAIQKTLDQIQDGDVQLEGVQLQSFGFQRTPPVAISFSERTRLWGIYLLLTFFSCVNYGALFCFLGVLVPRRAMVVAVAYSLILEIIVAIIPAMINQFTVQYRLRSLLIDWIGGDIEKVINNSIFQSNVAQWQHILILILLAPFLLSVSAYILNQKELLASEDAT